MSKKVDEPSRFGGTVNEILGSIKEKTGKVLGNKSMEAKGHMQREMGNAEVEAAKNKKKVPKTTEQDAMKGPLVNQPQRTTPEPGYSATPPTYSTVNNPTTENPMQRPESDLSYTSTGTTSTIDDPTKFTSGIQKNRHPTSPPPPHY